MKLTNSKLQIKITGASSRDLGNCESCGSYCSDVHHIFGWNGEKYVDLFGCLNCCQEVYRKSQ